MDRILKLSKEQKTLICAYLRKCYDCSDYDRAATKENIFEIFYNEAGRNLKRRGYSLKQAFSHWLQGLASACRVDFETYQQEKLLKAWEISVKGNEDASDVFYTALSTAFLAQFSNADICAIVNK